MAEGARQVSVFVSSPTDARLERARLERVIERLNGEFQGVAQLNAIRWETEFYKAHETFQAQIPEAAQCDIVIGIFRSRLGTELPANFPHMEDGQPYPSGTAYEVLSAIQSAKGSGLPDVYVFRYPQPPTVQLEDPRRAETEAQWERLKGFFETWFRTPTGQFKAAFQTFISTDDFETQVDALLRKWFEQSVLRGRSAVWPVEIKGSPFRGLAAFGVKHASVFFGRNRDIAKALDRLKDAAEKGCPFLLIDGASGAGKSSLARAGLLPRVTAAGVVPSVDLWRVAVMRPGEMSDDPFAALARALFARSEDRPEYERGGPSALPELYTSNFARAEDLAAQLAHCDSTALNPLVSTLDALARAERQSGGYERDVNTCLLLLVDQLDELFGLREGVGARFAKLLDILVRSKRIWVVATLRADFFDRLLVQPVLKQLKEDGASYDLAPPDAAALVDIVRGPAAAAGLSYEKDPANAELLDEVLLRDAARPDLLPLLQFTLNQLFEAARQSQKPNLLSYSAYRALGGLEGAVDKDAEAALQTLGDAEQARLPRLLRQLVVPARDRNNAVSPGRVPFDIHPVSFANAAYDETSTRLVRALVDARILLSSGADSQAILRLAHTRVLDAWQRAKAIVAENADFYRIRADLETQRRRWKAAVSGRERDLLLLRDPDLANGIHLKKRWGDELAPDLRTFITESFSAAKATVRRRWTIIVLVMIALAGLTIVSGVGFFEATIATRTAVRATAKFDVVRAAGESPKSGSGGSEITVRLLDELDRLVGIEIAPKSILWFDPRPKDNASEVLAFQKMGFRVQQVSTIADALKNAGKNFDLIISHYGLHSGTAQPDAYVLKQALEASKGKSIPMIIYSSAGVMSRIKNADLSCRKNWHHLPAISVKRKNNIAARQIDREGRRGNANG